MHTFTHFKNTNSHQYLKHLNATSVVCWPLVPNFAGSQPAEAVGFLG